MNEHGLSPEQIARLRAGRAIAALLGPGWLTPEEAEPLLADRQALKKIRDLVDQTITRGPEETLLDGVRRLVEELTWRRAGGPAIDEAVLSGSAHDRHWQRLVQFLGPEGMRAERARMLADQQAERDAKKLATFRKDLPTYRRWLAEAEADGCDHYAKRLRKQIAYRERFIAEAACAQPAEGENSDTDA